MDRLTQRSNFLLQLRTSVRLIMCSYTQNEQTFLKVWKSVVDNSTKPIKSVSSSKNLQRIFISGRCSFVKYISNKTILETIKDNNYFSITNLLLVCRIFFKLVSCAYMLDTMYLNNILKITAKRAFCWFCSENVPYHGGSHLLISI